MLKGRVRADGTAWLPFQLVGERTDSLEGLVDTGFDDYLILPRHLKTRARLKAVGYSKYELADGKRVRLRVYLGRIRFDGRTLAVPLVVSDSEDPILGTSLFRRRRLTIRYARRSVRLERDS